MSPDAAPPPRATLVAGALGAAHADAGLARLPGPVLATLGLATGDTVALHRPDGTGPLLCLRVLRGPAGSAEIALDDGARRSAGLALGDSVTLAPAAPVPATAAAFEVVEGDRAFPLAPAALVEALADRPLVPGETLRLRALPTHALRVTRLAPDAPARLTPATDIAITDGIATGFPGIAGLDDQIRRVREMVELPLRRPDLFATLGLAPPRGVLFTGPPGTGKTLLARCLAEATDATFFAIDAGEIVAKHYGESEKRLRRLFAEAARGAPAIIFIDEIDALAPRRGAMSEDRQLERRVVAQLLTLLDGLEGRGDVVVIGATNMPDALDLALRRPGRFDREIRFDAPDAPARAAILALHLAKTPLAPETDLKAVAARAEGYTGADLAALAREACLAAACRADATPGAPVAVGPADLDGAFREVGPSLLRDLVVSRPAARFADIGGLDAARDALVEAFVWPRTHAATARRLGVEVGRGVLLAGPPGTGKTLLARALAGEVDAPFLVARGSRLLSRYLGEAERAVADIFDRARQAAPVVLFLDELDAIAPARGAAEPALQRLVAQLLVEIDGIERGPGIFLLAATNRVGAIDPALLRPGRFDRVIEVGLPDRAARAEILELKLRGRALAPELDPAAHADRLDGLSGAAIEGAVDAAARAALRRAITTGGAEPAITADDLAAAIEARRPDQHPAQHPDQHPDRPGG